MKESMIKEGDRKRPQRKKTSLNLNILKTLIGTIKRNVIWQYCLTSPLIKFRNGTGIEERKKKMRLQEKLKKKPKS